MLKFEINQTYIGFAFFVTVFLFCILALSLGVNSGKIGIKYEEPATKWQYEKKTFIFVVVMYIVVGVGSAAMALYFLRNIINKL